MFDEYVIKWKKYNGYCIYNSVLIDFIIVWFYCYEIFVVVILIIKNSVLLVCVIFFVNVYCKKINLISNIFNIRFIF